LSESPNFRAAAPIAEGRRVGTHPRGPKIVGPNAPHSAPRKFCGFRDRLLGKIYLGNSGDRFIAKATTIIEGKPKYSEPLRQIQDQIGARIITFYRSDVDRIAGIIQKYYRPIESKDMIPESEWEFGYFGRHYVLLVPSDVVA
jgi:hypothetical protein